MLLFKNTDHKVMDVDEEHRKVLIYVNAFNNLDHDGDITEPGAFKKTIAERGPKSNKPQIKHLRDHWVLIGKPEEMTEDHKGLLVLSVLSNSTKGKDTIEDYKLNLLEHSIGYEVVRKRTEPHPDDESREITYLQELKLWEYSSLPWGANDQTPLVEMKGWTLPDQLKRLSAMTDKISNALKSGDYTDERAHQLEYQLQVLTKSYTDIIESLQPEVPPEPNQVKSDIEAIFTKHKF